LRRLALKHLRSLHKLGRLVLVSRDDVAQIGPLDGVAQRHRPEHDHHRGGRQRAPGLDQAMTTV
jgi:hypothetical protein